MIHEDPIKVIPTRYSGIVFRSRTEARWAVFFDSVGLRWEYEPEGYILGDTAYLPDFLLRDIKLFIEVKGGIPTADECEKCRRLAASTHTNVFCSMGAPKTKGGLLFPAHPLLEDSEPEPGMSTIPQAFFAACRGCENLALRWDIRESNGSPQAWGQIPLRCRLDTHRCGDKLAPYGYLLNDAISAASNHRFDTRSSLV